MQTALSIRQPGPAMASTLFIVVIALLPGVAFGQEEKTTPIASPTREIDRFVESTQQREAELEELRRVVDEHGDRPGAKLVRAELSRRRARKRRDLSRLVALLTEADTSGIDVSAAREVTVGILEGDRLTLLKNLEKTRLESFDLVDAAELGSAAESEVARRKLAILIPKMDRIVGYLDMNLDQRKQLGVDVEADISELTTGIQLRADFAASLLQGTKEWIDDISALPGVDKDTEAQRELASLRKQRNVLAESQHLNVGLLDKHGLETSELKLGIILFTGRLSQDIFDEGVAAGWARERLDDLGNWLGSRGVAFLFEVLVFSLVLFGFWILSRLAREAVRRGLGRERWKLSTLARNFFINATGRLVMLLGLVVALAQVGIELAPLLAGLGIAGLVIGFAMQDTLSNFASGLMILIYRPFDVGSWIEAGGVTGQVDQMSLVSTIILTGDNQEVILPNKQVWSGMIRNITQRDIRRVDMTFGIGYADDIPHAEKVLSDIVASHDKVLRDPEPLIRVNELGDSAVNLIVRPWAKTSDYWTVYWDITREVKQRFDAEGISIPFPQRDMHFYRESAGLQSEKAST
ncbi:MAG: mechanosensitive ion channel family protein [Rhodothermales bacterium]|nr:mechanosensitive ion channel family protein [Rhodothermales bacterium]